MSFANRLKTDPKFRFWFLSSTILVNLILINIVNFIIILFPTIYGAIIVSVINVLIYILFCLYLLIYKKLIKQIDNSNQQINVSIIGQNGDQNNYKLII